MNLQSPLARVLGLGSARSGTSHWISQRLTAVALVPLTLWFVASLLSLESIGFDVVHGWVGQPLNAILLLVLLVALLYHSSLGLTVVVEDYVHTAWAKVAMLFAVKLGHAFLAIAGMFSIIMVASGSAA